MSVLLPLSTCTSPFSIYYYPFPIYPWGKAFENKVCEGYWSHILWYTDDISNLKTQQHLYILQEYWFKKIHTVMCYNGRLFAKNIQYQTLMNQGCDLQWCSYHSKAQVVVSHIHKAETLSTCVNQKLGCPAISLYLKRWPIWNQFYI